jgi:hypothetical protein
MDGPGAQISSQACTQVKRRNAQKGTRLPKRESSRNQTESLELLWLGFVWDIVTTEKII